jgi:hypothetical protein
MGIAIRGARPDDALAMAQVWVATARVAHLGILPDDYLAAMSVAWGHARLRERLLLEDGALAVVAEDAGQVIGFALAVWPCTADPAFDAEFTQIYLTPYTRAGASVVGWLGRGHGSWRSVASARSCCK